MKNKFFIIPALLLMACCAKEYDDTSLKNSLDELEYRVSVLEDRCRRINTNISALENIIAKSPEKDRISSVVPIMEDDVLIGYTISFVYGEPIVIYVAQDGEDGLDGVDGKDGQDGLVPAISIITENGVSYWALNGEFILDADGQRVPLIVNGGESSVGRTPMLKIENGLWYYSMDSGKTWQKVEVTVTYGLGNIFDSVSQTNTDVVFTLSDGSTISFPKKADISLSLSAVQLSVPAMQSVQLNYTVAGTDNGTVVDAFAQGDWRAEVIPSNAKEGVVVITAPAASGPSSVVVFATASTGLSVYRTVKVSIQ